MGLSNLSNMEFGYDTMGNLTSVDYPDGFVTANYTYGAATHLLTGVSVTGSGGTFNLATSLSHNSAGGLESVTFGNGFITTVTPDVRNRPATWVTGIGPDDLLNNDFVYDAFGNITEIGSDDYGYDNLNRLTTSTVNGTSFGYSYDSVGNIETVTKGGSPAGSFGYNNNKIEALLPSGYDADGNLIDDGVNTYVYDALGQTASVTNSGGTVSYRYDALGKRILANDGSVDTVYAYLGEQLIAEFDGTTYSNSVFLEGQLLARVTDNGVDTTTVRYAHLNHLGSPVAFTDSAANVIWPEQVGGTPYEIHNYEPFGADFDDIGTPALSPQDVRYTGKLLDAGTGKHYFNARYLNAVTDVASPELPPRFLSPDIVIGTPDSPQSWNRYASCLNNPVNLIDPDGLSTIRIYTNKTGNSEPVTLVDPTIDEFRTAINAQESGSINRLEIHGHGSTNHLDIEPGVGGHGIAWGNKEKGVVFTDTGEKFADFIKAKLGSNATIDLIGCNTAREWPWTNDHITNQLSKELPERTVIGSRGFALGNEIGKLLNRNRYMRFGKENHVLLRFTRTYQNGEELE